MFLRSAEAVSCVLDVAESQLLWWLRWPRICLQCRRPGLDPWVRKIPWRREWQHTSVFLPGESHGQRRLTSKSMGSQTVGHDWATNTAPQTNYLEKFSDCLEEDVGVKRGNNKKDKKRKITEWKQCQTFFLWAPKSLQMVTAAMKLRHLLLGSKVMTNLDSILKSRDITLPTKVRLVKAMVFPVVMYGYCPSYQYYPAKWKRGQGKISLFPVYDSKELLFMGL